MRKVGAILAGVASFATMSLACVETSYAQAKREITFNNECNHSVRILVHHADGYRNWHPHAWFYFKAYESGSFISNENVRLTQSDDHELYFYAEATDGSGKYWEGDDTYVVWEGIRYGLTKAKQVVRQGRTSVTLAC